MSKDNWDEKLKKEIFNILKYHGIAERDFNILFQKDRKHQQEEMLKQVSSVKKIDDMVKNHFGLLINKVPRGLFAKAIHDLIERKLEKRCGNCAYADEGYCYLHNSEIGEDGVCENWKEVSKEKESEN